MDNLSHLIVRFFNEKTNQVIYNASNTTFGVGPAPNDNVDQHWKLEPVNGKSLTYKLRNTKTNNVIYNALGGVFSVGVDTTDNDDQHWKLQPVSGKLLTYRLRNIKTNNVIYHDSNGKLNAGPAPTDNDGYNDQWWRFVYVKSPLIFLPGVLGSKIQAYDKKWYYSDGWWDAWPATASSWIEMMKFTDSRKPIYGSRCVDILRQAMFGNPPIPVKDVYKLTIDKLSSLGYKEGENLFVFPYDFRFNLDEISNSDQLISERQSLCSFIQEVKQKTGFSQVDLLCHSMGGIVALNYLINKPENINNIGRVVLLGSPVFGAAKAFASLVCGLPPDEIYDYLAGIWSPTRSQWKEISRYFYPPYQLIPNRFLTEALGSFISINRQDQNYEQAHGLNPSDVINSDSVISHELLRNSCQWKDDFITKLKDKWRTLDLKSHVYFIQGIGIPTPVKYEIVYPSQVIYDDIPPYVHIKDTDWSLGKDVKTITSEDGDGTVLNYGPKEILGVEPDHLCQFPKIKHLNLATDPNVIEYVAKIFSPVNA
jgi:hypothetical protein